MTTPKASPTLADRLRRDIGNIDSRETVKLTRQAADALDAAEESRRNILRAEHDLSAAYVRLRQMIPGALNTGYGPSGEQVWAHTEACLKRTLDAQAQHIARLKSALEMLVEKSAGVQCACSIRERISGHRSGCDGEALSNAQTAAREALRETPHA